LQLNVLLKAKAKPFLRLPTAFFYCKDSGRPGLSPQDEWTVSHQAHELFIRGRSKDMEDM
jgi:hypothetical protein